MSAGATTRPPGPRIAWLQNLTTRFPRLQRAGSRFHARLYRRSGGRVGRRWLGGAPVMVLETVGRRSGRPRATPVLYLRDGERLVITPANAGAKRMPDWWLNLQAAKEATALIGERRLRVRPRVAEGDERERLWHEFAARLAALNEYSRFTFREFPIVVLERERG